MVCWADGGQAMQGINAMDSVAKALRAWTLPYCIPIVRRLLIDPETNTFTDEYQHKFDLMTQLLSSTDIPKYSFKLIPRFFQKKHAFIKKLSPYS